MLKNYIKIAIRHLWQNRLYSCLNIAGLSVALAGVMLAILYSNDEHNFDKFHTNSPNLYRITTSYTDNKTGATQTVGGTGQVQGPAFKAQLPDIIEYTRIWGGDIKENVKAGDKAFNLGTAFVDSTFFKVLSFPLLYGNPSTALNDMHAVVITEKTALKFFGTSDVVGKRMEVADNPDSLFASFIITGVAKDPPSNSSIQFDILIPFSYLKIMFDDHAWLNAYLGTFVKLHPSADIKSLEQKFIAIHNVHAKEQLAQAKKSGEFDKRTAYGLQPITEMHLEPLYSSSTSREGGSANGSSPTYSYFLLGIAIFILVMASINFVNLSIANSLKRAKEIGVRKVSGGSKGQIITQFLIESSILCFISFVLAFIIAQNILPFFNDVSGKQLTLSPAKETSLIVYLAALLLLNILLAGFYPAFVLSGFKPTEVLYNKQRLTGHNLLGKSLVVVQFALSVSLIICSVIYYRQMNFMRTKELGYNPDNILLVEIPPRRDTKAVYNQLKQELSKEPAIEQMSIEANFDGGYKMAINDRTVEGSYKLIEEQYIPMLGISIQQGRNFSSAYGTDKTNGAIVNEAFVRMAGLKDPIGKQIRTNDWFVNENLVIVGVVKDFHYASLRKTIHPLVFTLGNNSLGNLVLKINKNRYKQALAALEKAYKQAVPGSEYSYAFWNDMNAKDYTQELKWQKIITVATGLSILICCLGLFGLANLSASRRIKEIGIRKVLGASVMSIASLLSIDFLKLVIIGFVIASPIAWWIMHSWLENFAYRTDISISIFIIAAITALIIAVLSVSFQAAKAAIANPAKSLRTE
jgi:putative ABC transport system permease protein